MANWGMKISRDGINVNTGADRDMVFTSKYSCLKGSLSGSGSKSVSNNGTVATVTIPHSLGSIPMVQGFFSENNVNFQILPYFNLLSGGGLFTQYHHNVEADSTNVYLRFQITELLGGATNYTVYYKYFIFIDKGKL